jgi:hypothetical protein
MELNKVIADSSWNLPLDMVASCCSGQWRPGAGPLPLLLIVMYSCTYVRLRVARTPTPRPAFAVYYCSAVAAAIPLLVSSCGWCSRLRCQSRSEPRRGLLVVVVGRRFACKCNAAGSYYWFRFQSSSRLLIRYVCCIGVRFWTSNNESPSACPF